MAANFTARQARNSLRKYLHGYGEDASRYNLDAAGAQMVEQWGHLKLASAMHRDLSEEQICELIDAHRI